MGRKRKRDKRKRETESLQVELLSGAEPPRTADGQLTRPNEPLPMDAPKPGAGPPESDPPERPESRRTEVEQPPVVSERWVKAVGRRESARRKSAHELPSERVGSDAPAKVAAENGDATPRDPHESARDHAAAVRPAGEPLARAKDLVQRGRVQEAIELYLGILTVNPSNLKAHNNLGVLFDELKRYDAALEHLQAAERLAPENVEVLTNFASTLTSLARYEDAEAALRRAQRIDADDLQVRLAIGILYFRRGLYAQAEVDLRWVCARARDNGLAFYYRGEALNRLSRFDESQQVLERAAELLPEDPRPFYTLGHLYDRKHLGEEAAEMYRRARQLQSS
jgi:tetratricopeptide (TPR) repeat protein